LTKNNCKSFEKKTFLLFYFGLEGGGKKTFNYCSFFLPLSYMDEEDDEELCTSDLQGNKLTLVLRDGKGFYSFVKYLNQEAHGHFRLDLEQTWKFTYEEEGGATLGDLFAN
jgi:hypothetical protein